jgi:NTE family protein
MARGAAFRDCLPMSDQQQFADLVFEGGGVKGIGLAGAFAALQEQGIIPQRVAGTSAGAINAALVAAGYTAEELDRILLEVPFRSFMDEGPEDKVPFAGHGISALTQLGIYEGAAFERWITGLLEAKGITRFGQLADPEAETIEDRYRLKVIASDVTRRCMLVLPDDADQLGLDPDELEIAKAVRMSMSIPVFFEPVIHRNPRTGQDHVIVDGGMLSNFPVWLFDCKDRDPRWPTFGLMLVAADPREPVAPADAQRVGRFSPLGYVRALASTMMEAHDRMYMEAASFARTIPIPTLGVGTTEFDIRPDRVKALYASGHGAATDFLARWDFDAYIEEFRRGKDHSRRAESRKATMTG